MGTTCSLVDGRFILLIIAYFIGGVLCENKQLNKTTKPCSPWWRPLPFQYWISGIEIFCCWVIIKMQLRKLAITIYTIKNTPVYPVYRTCHQHRMIVHWKYVLPRQLVYNFSCLSLKIVNSALHWRWIFVFISGWHVAETWWRYLNIPWPFPIAKWSTVLLVKHHTKIQCSGKQIKS